MCNLQEHSDRSAREHAAQRQEPIYTELAAKYGIDYQPPAVADGKSARNAQRACAITVWDGPYKMTCSYMIVNGRCVRHGKGGATYEVKS